jgi:predicted nucleic acid-binding Zn ribbon protein
MDARQERNLRSNLAFPMFQQSTFEAIDAISDLLNWQKKVQLVIER